MNNAEYYLNRLEFGSCIPSDGDKHLSVGNHLSEFNTEEDKNEVRDNLGITDIVDELNLKIDNKVIASGDIAWDYKPTLGNVDKVLSSSALYNTLLKYALRKEVDHHILEIWLNTRKELAKLYNNVECEINLLNLSLRSYVDDIKCSFSNGMLENKIMILEKALNSLAKTGEYGTVILDNFGSNNYATMSLRAITDAINNIWDKIESMTGENIQGIDMTITPDYFIKGKRQPVHIKATSTSEGTFEHVAFYINGGLVGEDYNTNRFETDVVITDTTLVECVAKILGIEYRRTKTIDCIDNFFLLSGKFNTDEEIMDTAYSNKKYSIPLTRTLRSNRDIECADLDHIIVILPKSLSAKFLRLDMNGIEIPCDIHYLDNYHEDGLDYVLYISKNVYSEGTYNIDING